jgi:hypothetical protein
VYVLDAEFVALAREVIADCRRLLKAWEESKHPRAADGRFGSGGGRGKKPTAKKPAKKKRNPRPVRKPPPTIFGAAEQTHAEGMQDKLAVAIDAKAHSIPGSAPSDVERVEQDGSLSAVEVKTKLKSRNVRMSSGAQARKLKRLQQHQQQEGKPARLHTVAFDHRQQFASGTLNQAPEFPAHYKRGGGSFPLTEMYLVANAEELNRLMTAEDAELPEAAKPTTTGWWGQYHAASAAERKKMIDTALAREASRAARKKKGKKK